MVAKVERISLKDRGEQAKFVFFFLAILSLLLTFVVDRN